MSALVESITLKVLLGSGVPSAAPSVLMDALQSVQVQVPDHGTTTFNMSFIAQPSRVGKIKNPVVSHALLQPMTRVVLMATVGSSATIILDGFITHQQLGVSAPGAPPMFTVTGEDVSVKMDIEEKSQEYLNLDSARIVQTVLAQYSSLGLTATVSRPKFVDTPPKEFQTRVQNETDLQWVQRLARYAGFVFYVTPGTSVGRSVAFWGEPTRSGEAQPALTVNQGAYTNVDRLNLAYAPLRAARATAKALNVEGEQDQVMDYAATRSSRQPLAAEPALTALGTDARTRLPRHGGATAAQVQQLTQGVADRSSDQAVRVEGSLRVQRYGAILKPRALVGLRGVGQSFDGTYYVQSVTHDFSRGDYQQQFSLTREGLGALSTTVRAS